MDIVIVVKAVNAKYGHSDSSKSIDIQFSAHDAFFGTTFIIQQRLPRH
jgi:hypothetical protein